MTSEGKSAREPGMYTENGDMEQTIRAAIVNAQGEMINIALTELSTRRLVEAFERESRLSIAAALEQAANLCVDRWVHPDGCRYTCHESDAGRIRALSYESVAQARAEHDREVREKALQDAHDAVDAIHKRAQRQAASPEDSGGKR